MRFIYFALAFLATAHARLILQTDHYSFGTTEFHRTIDIKKAMAIEFMQDMTKKHAIPGYALSVVYKNQTIIAQGFGTKQYGNASNVVTPNTQFQIGSYSKTFIAMGIAKLVDEGKMKWSDSVKQHLPWFALQDKYAEEYTTIDAAYTILPFNTCDPHFYDGKPWEQIGRHIPQDKLSTLAGVYTSTSPDYYVNMSISIINNQAVLRRLQFPGHFTMQTTTQQLHTYGHMKW
ncbi:hypothetical protein THRCLA_03949 [Thraustotheca clavata]|uniref:Beta-lactamase-related domain-containing protein n=1 Tax=Thraustotheca clavata TaxID=74557 RepID=A0A1W0A0F5_9STRA|nr:hypothetical protein THRCLA_03949 [Thraustotheca clavata]